MRVIAGFIERFVSGAFGTDVPQSYDAYTACVAWKAVVAEASWELRQKHRWRSRSQQTSNCSCGHYCGSDFLYSEHFAMVLADTIGADPRAPLALDAYLSNRMQS